MHKTLLLLSVFTAGLAFGETAELKRGEFAISCKSCPYVDKTAMLLPLCDLSIGKQFFMARPRRFGKSLLVSTLHCLFEGRRFPPV